MRRARFFASHALKAYAQRVHFPTAFARSRTASLTRDKRIFGAPRALKTYAPPVRFPTAFAAQLGFFLFASTPRCAPRPRCLDAFFGFVKSM